MFSITDLHILNWSRGLVGRSNRCTVLFICLDDNWVSAKKRSFKQNWMISLVHKYLIGLWVKSEILKVLRKKGRFEHKRVQFHYKCGLHRLHMNKQSRGIFADKIIIINVNITLKLIHVFVPAKNPYDHLPAFSCGRSCFWMKAHKWSFPVSNFTIKPPNMLQQRT